jgi:Fe-S-cluster containining protein
MTEHAQRDSDPVARPGTPSFHCLADECGAMCCRNPYRVDLGEDEVVRLAGQVDVWEVVEERAAMVLMRQSDDACVLLTGDLRCGEYEVRPKGCRDYPFRLELSEGRSPLVTRDLACPGFVGPPMTNQEYEELVASLALMSEQR